MKLKVVKHHNYGKAMEATPDENNIVSDLFYFCFFELNNGKKLSIHTYKSYDNQKKSYLWNTFVTTNEKGESVNLGEYSISYADDYKFGEDFFDWFERIHPAADVSEYPTDEENNLIVYYYENNIKPLNA